MYDFIALFTILEMNVFLIFINCTICSSNIHEYIDVYIIIITTKKLDV